MDTDYIGKGISKFICNKYNEYDKILNKLETCTCIKQQRLQYNLHYIFSK